jgi:hypothetical protein
MSFELSPPLLYLWRKHEARRRRNEEPAPPDKAVGWITDKSQLNKLA